MTSQELDLHSIALLEHESIGLPETHVRALALFRDSVVRPSLLVVDGEIRANDASDEPGAAFFEGDLAELHQATVEGYLLTVQSMWERGLRGLLVKRDKRLCGGQNVERLHRANWSNDTKGLQSHFERLLAVPLSAFDSYSDLDLLQNLGNAIRHGDGQSAKRVHELAPSLWWNWFPPGTTYDAGPFKVSVPADWPAHPSFDKVTLTEAVLEQMIHAVSGFWTDIECIRCNSFRRIDETVRRRLDAWPAEREQRRRTRFWTPT